MKGDGDAAVKGFFQLSPSGVTDGFFRVTNHPRLLVGVATFSLLAIASEGFVAVGPNALGVAMLILLVGALGAALFGRGDWSRFRTEPVQLFLVALDLRLVAVLFGWHLKTSLGLLASNPDARVYLYWADRVAGALHGTLMDIRPFAMAGTWEVFFHYLLAVVLWLGRGDLLGAQTVLAVLSALSCVPVFLVSRVVAGRDGRFVGAVWAVLPYSIYLGAGDFLKDAVVVLAVFTVLAAASWNREEAGRRAAALVIMTASFTILRTTRFYFAVVLGVALLTFLVADSLRAGIGNRLRPARLTSAVAIVATAIFGAELLLRVAGFPFGAPLLIVSARQAVRNPAAVQTSAGRADSLSQPGSTIGASVADEGVAIAAGPSRGASGQDSSPRVETSVLPGTPAPLANGVPVRSRSRLLGVFRRLFGPYFWTPPTRDFARLMTSGDIPSWLSVPVWYFAFAFGGLGIWRLIRERSWLSRVVASLCVVFGGVLLFFNVSFRQRDAILLPFLLIAAVVGWSGSSVAVRERVTLAAVAVLALLSVVYWGMRVLLRL